LLSTTLINRNCKKYSCSNLFACRNERKLLFGFNKNNDNDNNNSFIYPAKMNQLVLKEKHAGINTCAALNMI